MNNCFFIFFDINIFVGLNVFIYTLGSCFMRITILMYRRHGSSKQTYRDGVEMIFTMHMLAFFFFMCMTVTYSIAYLFWLYCMDSKAS